MDVNTRKTVKEQVAKAREQAKATASRRSLTTMQVANQRAKEAKIKAYQQSRATRRALGS